MKLSDRIKRWWSPAKWRDEHPEVSHGEEYVLNGEQVETKYGLDNPDADCANSAPNLKERANHPALRCHPRTLAQASALLSAKRLCVERMRY
jgi:hypothetical protein